MSRFLFDHLDDLGPRLRAARSLALFLDFDGTLAPFQDRGGVQNVADSLTAIKKLVFEEKKLTMERRSALAWNSNSTSFSSPATTGTSAGNCPATCSMFCSFAQFL